MNNRNPGILILVIAALLLLQTGNQALAANGKQLNPDLATKREMVHKQQEQRVTPEKRKAAAEALKAERLRVYRAKQTFKQANPSGNEQK